MLFLAGNTGIYCHLPFQQIMTEPCMGLAQSETVTGDQGQFPWAAAHAQESSIFSPTFTFSLVFYFFTDSRDLNGKMDFILLLILPSSTNAWLARVN